MEPDRARRKNTKALLLKKMGYFSTVVFVNRLVKVSILAIYAPDKLLKKEEGSVADSTLVFLYRDLSAPEMRRLGKWVESPAHNLREDVRALHRYFSGGERLYKTSALSKSRLWKRLFPGRPYDDARLRQAFYQATRCVEAFLAYENWSRRPMSQPLSLLNELQQRNLGGQVERYLGKADRRMDDLPHRDEVYYASRNQLEQERYAYTAYHHPLDRPNFDAISESLDVNYLINKLRVGCNALFHQRKNGTTFDTRSTAWSPCSTKPSSNWRVQMTVPSTSVRTRKTSKSLSSPNFPSVLPTLRKP